ncbi:MAG: hypothetical protein ACRC6M_19950, partial [Microcystaceae cyanobacterium]
MKGKCPNCNTDLRYVKSINQLLCNDCGFSESISVNDPLLITLSKPSINKKNNNNLVTLILISSVIIFSGFSTLLIWSKFQEISRRETISKDVSKG